MIEVKKLKDIENELSEMYWELKFEDKRAAWRLDTIIGKLQQLIKIIDENK